MRFLPVQINISQYCLCFLALWIFFVLSGCKKDKADGTFPIISFTNPNSGAIYYHGDAIQIRASVSDDREIKSIRIQITNASNQTFLQDIYYTNEGKSKDINTAIFNNDLYINSGVYFVKITASDGINESIAFREIQIYSAPVVLKHVCTITQPPNEWCQIDSLTSNGLVNFQTYFGRYSFGDLDSRHSIGIISTAVNCAINTFNFPDLEAISNFSAFVIDDDYYTAINFDDAKDVYFIGGKDGRIWKILNKGEIQLAIEPINSGSIKYLEVTENFIYALTENITGTSRDMVVYFRDSGLFYHSSPIDFEAKGILKIEDENHILVVGNDVGSHFEIYNNETNAMNGVFNFYNQNVVSGIWPASDDNFYVYHSDGLTYYTNNLDSYNVGLNIIPVQVKYESLSNKVFVAASDGLHILNEPATSELNFYPHANLKDIWFQYNK